MGTKYPAALSWWYVHLTNVNSYKENLKLKAKHRSEQLSLFSLTMKYLTLQLSTYSSSRYSEFYENPLDFRPERFDPQAEERIPSYTYYPFSIGPRNCIGQTFAQIEAKVLLAKFVQRFNIHIDMEQSFAVQETTTIRPIDGTRCTLTLRDLNNNEM